jgi:PAS domain S-box-containing protein
MDNTPTFQYFFDRMADKAGEQLARLRGLNAVYQALSAVELSAFSLPLLLQIVLETGAKLTGAKYGALGVFDESGAKLSEFITVGLDEKTKIGIGTSPMGFGLLGAMTDEPGALRLKDLTRHPKSVGFPPHHPPMKSFLGISIRAHGRLFGRLYLTEKQGAEEFSEIDAEIITALAAQAGTILERGLLIEQLKSAEARHRQILESAAEGIYGLDLDGICTFINKTGAAMLGYRPKEIIGRRMHSLVHHTRHDGSPYPEEECPTERSRRHGRPAHLIEDSYWRKDGTTFPVQLSCAPMLSDGTLRGVVVTFFDVTDRKQAEQRKALNYGITRAASESETIDEANQKILQTICEVLGWEWSAVWQVDKQANVLRCMTAWHRPEISVPEFEAATCRITFAPGVGLPGRVWSTGKPAYISDVTRDPNFPRAAVASKSGIRSGFAFPIRLGGAVVGVMEFFSRESREPSRDVLNTLASLGSPIGLQIERKRVEETIRASEAWLHQVLDTLPAAAYTCDADGLITYFNESARALWGRSPRLNDPVDRYIGSLKLFRPDGAPIANDECWMAVALRERRVVDGKEIVTERPDGSRRSVLAHATPMFDPSGRLTGAVNVLVDITDRKKMEESLRESERTYSTLVSNLPGLVYRCHNDQNWTVQFISEGVLALTGHAASEFMQHRIHFGQLIHPDDRETVWNNVQAALQARCPYELTYRIRTKAGEERWVWEQGQGVFSPNGDLLFLEGFIADITSQKLAEAERTRLSMILESSLNEIYVFDAGTLRFLHVNSGALQNLGYTLDAIRTMTPLDLKPEFSETSFRRLIAPLLQRQKDVIVFQTVHRRANSSLYPVEVHLQLMVSDGEQVFLAIINDITERKRAEEALRDAHHRLQKAQEEERKRIAREIHDELGQQLTMLRFGLVKLAQSEQLPSAELRNQVRTMIQPVDTTIDTVRRIATALRPAILDDLGLAAALEWLVTDFRAKTDTPCDVSLGPVPAGLDDTRSLTLFRILQEALTNVARHAQATRVMVGLRQIGDALELEVRDNGRGLTEAQRASPAAVGLFGMQERALGVGGTVTIRSRPNEGTTVTARIPLRNGQ